MILRFLLRPFFRGKSDRWRRNWTDGNLPSFALLLGEVAEVQNVGCLFFEKFSFIPYAGKIGSFFCFFFGIDISSLS